MHIRPYLPCQISLSGARTEAQGSPRAHSLLSITGRLSEPCYSPPPLHPHPIAQVNIVNELTYDSFTRNPQMSYGLTFAGETHVTSSLHSTPGAPGLQLTQTHSPTGLQRAPPGRSVADQPPRFLVARDFASSYTFLMGVPPSHKNLL